MELDELVKNDDIKVSDTQIKDYESDVKELMKNGK